MHQMQRQIFEFNDTGTAGDTGPAFSGFVHQLRWANDTGTAGDTGCDLQIALLPRMGDTGDGWLIYSKTNVMGSNFFDTNDTGLTRTAAAGDRLRVKIINQAGVATALQGRLYVWVG